MSDAIGRLTARALAWVAGLCAICLLFASATAPAAGADPSLTRMYLGSFAPSTATQFQNPQNVAVDQSNGDVYVLDAGAQTVSRFDLNLKAKSFSQLGTNVIDGSATGTCGVNTSAQCDQTPANGFSFDSTRDGQVTVDDSGSPLTNGNIYVTDSLHRVVDVFAPTGAYVGQLTATGVTPLGEPCGVSVDSSGALYVGDTTLNKVDKFVPATNPPTNADFVASFTSSQPCELAAGAATTAGALFVNKKNGVVTKLNAAGVLEYQLSTAVSRGLAVDPASGHAFLALGPEVAEYDASSATAPSLVNGFGSTVLSTASAVAVDAARDRVYVPDTTTGRVNVFGPLTPAVAPAVALGPVIPLAGGREGLTGYVDAESADTTYYFESGESDCSTGPCTSVPATEDAALSKGSGPIRVTQTVSGLRAGATYHYRLVAANVAGTTASPDGTFTTLGTPPGAGPCGNESIRAAQGLRPDFPSCRAYELVSPFPAAERNNADVFLATERVRAATDGGAFEFPSLSGAGDAHSVSAVTEYVGVRDPGAGWAVHGVAPRLPGASVNGITNGDREPSYVGEFTPDLSKATYLSPASLSEEGPNVDGIWNLYRREDLLVPGLGTYRLLSDAATPQSPFPVGQSSGEDTESPHIVGASTDLSHVVFESPRNLTVDAAALGAGPRLYESADGAVRLVGVLPSSEGGGPSIAQAGQGFSILSLIYVRPVVSANGSRVLFTAPPFDRLRVGGRLYLRDDHETTDPSDDTTVRVSASEKTNDAGPGGSDPAGTQPATFWGASKQLSQVFFTSTEALTDDAPSTESSVQKLYRYDLDAPAGQRLTLLSVDQNGGDGIVNGADGVIGVSDDGSYVYFIGSNQLVAGRPIAATSRIFLWHEGQVRQVAAINSGVEANRILGEFGVAESGKWARVSADGRHLVFVSEGTPDQTGNDQGTTCTTYASSRCLEVYVYSAGPEERLQCASCDPAGTRATADADFNARRADTLITRTISVDSYLNHALSASGGRVFFTTAERLSAYDQNDDPDVYEFDSATGRVHLLSGGRPQASSYFLDASSEGRDVFFATRDTLLAADENENVDVYDARIGGGFDESAPSAAVACASTEDCRPATSSAPAALTTVSDSAAPVKATRKARSKKKHKRRARPRKHRHHRHRAGRHRG
jgi:hypothetical protein